MPSILNFNQFKIVVLLFFLTFFITGLTVAKDYGVHLDEFTSHDFGVRWYKYAYDVIINGGPIIPLERKNLNDAGQNKSFADFHDQTHGPAIEMSIAFLADKVLHLEDAREIILLRHYCIWLLFYLSVIFFYFLGRLHFNNKKFALLGCLFLVLHPRIFANSFYDSVDIAFLSFYIICMYTLMRYMKTSSFTIAAIHAFTCGILIDIRLMGVVMPVLTYGLFLWDLVEARGDKTRALQVIRNGTAYSSLLIFFIILFWPYLWRNPISGIVEIVKLTSNIPFELTVLYFGEYVKAMKLPWHYIPVWISITTPILYSLFFVAGCFFIFSTLIKKRLCYAHRTKNDFLVVFAFVFPILLVIVFHSTLLDSWRHMFFVYPAFVLVALVGVEGCHKLIAKYCHNKTYLTLKAAIASAILVSFLTTGAFMIKYHPYQNVYFNCLVGQNMKTFKNNFDFDYWGLSYRQALEYIVKNDQSENIKVYDELFLGPLINNIKFLPPPDRKRIRQVWSLDEAKYSLTCYRWHKQEYAYPNEYFSIRVGNAKIVTVFKLKN